MTEEDYKLLKRIKGYLFPSNFMNAVYIPPSQAMRNAADEMDRKEEDGRALDELIKRISTELTSSNKGQ